MTRTLVEVQEMAMARDVVVAVVVVEAAAAAAVGSSVGEEVESPVAASAGMEAWSAEGPKQANAAIQISLEPVDAPAAEPGPVAGAGLGLGLGRELVLELVQAAVEVEPQGPEYEHA